MPLLKRLTPRLAGRSCRVNLYSIAKATKWAFLRKEPLYQVIVALGAPLAHGENDAVPGAVTQALQPASRTCCRIDR